MCGVKTLKYNMYVDGINMMCLAFECDFMITAAFSGRHTLFNTKFHTPKAGIHVHIYIYIPNFDVRVLEQTSDTGPMCGDSQHNG